MNQTFIASTLVAYALSAGSIAPAHANGGFSVTGPHGNTVSGSHWGSGPAGSYRGGYYHGGPCCGGGAVAAGAVAGLAVGTAIGVAGSRPAYVVPPPVFAAPAPVYAVPPPLYYPAPPVYRPY